MEIGQKVYVLVYFSLEDHDALIMGTFSSEDDARKAVDTISVLDEEATTPWKRTAHGSLICEIENDDYEDCDWASYWIKETEFGLLPVSYRR